VTEVWALPGYDVQALIGYGTTGEVWRASELATGDPVALKRLRPDADPDAVAAFRREAAVLRALDTPYVVRLRALLGEDADAVLVLDLATGGSLARLLARRGALDPAEVVTIGAPLAQALAAAHACGLVHGNVTAGNVLFTAEGMPLLADLGLSRFRPGGSGEAADDVCALAALCHQLLSGTPPHEGAGAPLGLLAPTAPLPLVSAIELALSEDQAQRPDAAAFAGMLRRSHAAAPIRFGARSAAELPDVRPAPVRPVVDSPAEPRRSLRPLVAAAVAAVLVVAAGVGWASGRAGSVEQASAATPAAAPTAPDWPAILDGLDGVRARAFAAADPSLLEQVYAHTSPLLARDRAAVLALRGLRAAGVRHSLRSLAVSAYDGSTATLRVIDVLSAYDVVDGSGAVVRHVTSRPPMGFVVVLVRTSAGWRLQTVTAA
jgi:hypothetical protein